MPDQLTALCKSLKQSLSMLNVKVSETAREIMSVHLRTLELADSPCRKQAFILILLIHTAFYLGDCKSTVKGRLGPIPKSLHPSPKCSYFCGATCLLVNQTHMAA